MTNPANDNTISAGRNDQEFFKKIETFPTTQRNVDMLYFAIKEAIDSVVTKSHTPITKAEIVGVIEFVKDDIKGI